MKKILCLLLLVAGVFIVYAPALRNGFVWDDTALILRDPLIRSWRLIPEGFQHFLFTDATASNFYRPIQRLTYTLEYAAFFYWPAPYHLTNIFIHAAAAVALLFFAQELLQGFGVSERLRKSVACFSALAWAIHPIHTGAVVYISGRADPLAAFFGFLGLYFGLRSLRAEGARPWLFTGAATLCFLLAALSKEIGLIFLLLWIAIHVLQKNLKRARNATGVAIVISVLYLSLRLQAEGAAPPAPRASIPPLVRPVVAARACAEYIGLVVLPWNLHMDRDVETHPWGFADASITASAWRELQTLLGVLLLAAAIYWMLRVRKRNPAVFSCLVLAAITYLPVSGIFLLNATIAEHWVYLPAAFFLLAAGLSLGKLLQAEGASPLLRKITGATLALWLVFLGARTFVRTFDWKDQRAFLEHTIAHGGDSARMLINLAGLELNEEKLEAARNHLLQALRKDPGQPLAALNLAAVAIKQNDFKTAREVLARATEMPLVAAQAHELLAVLEHKETGSTNLMRLRLASRTGPPNWSIEKRYVKVLDETGRTEAAITELQSCLRSQWYRAESWLLLSELLAKTGRHDEANAARARAESYDAHLARRGRVL